MKIYEARIRFEARNFEAASKAAMALGKFFRELFEIMGVHIVRVKKQAVPHA